MGSTGGALDENPTHLEECGAMETLTRLKAGQRINRKYARYLSPAEFKVVSYIWDQTIGFGHNEARITVRQIMNGRGKASDGTGLSRATVYRCLSALREMRLVVCSGLRFGANVLSINFEWLAERTIPLEGDVALATRKKGTPAAGKGLAPRKAEGSQGETLPRRKMRPHIKEREEGKIEDSVARSRTSPPPEVSGSEWQETKGGLKSPAQAQRTEASSVPEFPENKSSLKAILDGAPAAGAAREAKRRAKKRKPVVAEFMAVWEHAFREGWPGVPMMAWSPKARGLAKHAIKRGSFADIDYVEFWKWVVTEWGVLRATAFSWMTESPPPAHPVPEFALRFFDKIMMAYVQRAAIRTFTQRAHPDALRQHYRERGFSVEMAEMKAAGIKEAPDRVKAATAEAALLKQTLEREREDSRRREAAMGRKIMEAEKARASTPVGNIDPLNLNFKPFDEE